MRIAFITSEFPGDHAAYGGLASYLNRVTGALSQRGHSVSVITRDSIDTENVELPNGVSVIRVVPRWHKRMWLDRVDRVVPRSFYSSYQDFKAAWSIWKVWRNLKRNKAFDIVQMANCQATALFFHLERSIPIVARLSNYRPECDRLTGQAPSLGGRLRWYMEKKSLAAAHRVYAPSEFLANDVHLRTGLGKVDVIEPPYDPSESDWDAACFDATRPSGRYVLHFGGLSQLKGTHDVANALRLVLSVDDSLSAVFVGRDGIAPDGGSMKGYIREQLRMFENRVTILDSLAAASLAPFIQNASVVVLPSIYDNLPNTVIESMARGRIVIATTGVCFEQLIDHGVSGFLCPPSNGEELAATMLRALSMTEVEADEMGQAGRARIQLLHPDRAVPQLIEYYERVVADFHGTTRQAVRA